jgi:hypothetical protein
VEKRDDELFRSRAWYALNSFQLVGLSFDPFAGLFDLSDATLLERNVQRVFATTKPGYPCRVSLADAEIGEELLLLTSRLVRSSYAKQPCKPDSMHLMTDVVVCAGDDSAAAILRMFGRAEVAYIHLHNANRGCFACAVNRA